MAISVKIQRHLKLSFLFALATFKYSKPHVASGYSIRGNIRQFAECFVGQEPFLLTEWVNEFKKDSMRMGEKVQKIVPN